MTRVEKYHQLRNQITKEIQENAVIWEQEKKIEQYKNQLLKMNHDYFAPIIKKLDDSLKLINLESILLKNNYQYLAPKDKYLLIKLLSDLNNIFESYQPKSQNCVIEKTVVDYPLEYATLINSINQKIAEFETNLESKINDINAFSHAIERKYQKDNTSQNFDQSIKDIKVNSNKLQDDFQQLKIKGKNSYKISLFLFAIIIIALIVIVVLLLLLVV
ncbi:MAG: hypothetical protein REH79_01065 [Spiroplasma sp.]|nr:hypothetical protein [Spiroplasma sp.]